ncbi:hypothetical protein C8R43DRAFT_1140291 [Mycena crocata]|nr:hypothetical protein C8R43DRAFT_1140291 [Mycena crocata]
MPAARTERKKRTYQPVNKEKRQSLKSWAKGARESILEVHIAGYTDAAERDWRSERDYLQDVCNEFHSLIPWDLEDFVEPELPLPTYDKFAKLPTQTLSDEQKVEKRGQRIQRWLKYHSRKLRRGSVRMDSRNNPFVILLGKLAGINAPPKARQAFQQYMHESYDTEIAPAVEARFAMERSNLDGQGGAATQRGPNAPFQARVARELFAELSDEEQTALKERASAEAQEAKAKYEKARNEPPSKAPADRQRCIDELGKFMLPILRGVYEYTGLHAVAIFGGPIPRYGGELKTVHVAHGRNYDATPVAFPQWGGGGRFNRDVLGLMHDYLKTAFTEEERSAAALEDSTQAENTGGSGRAHSLDDTGSDEDEDIDLVLDDSGTEGESDGNDGRTAAKKTKKKKVVGGEKKKKSRPAKTATKAGKRKGAGRGKRKSVAAGKHKAKGMEDSDEEEEGVDWDENSEEEDEAGEDDQGDEEEVPRAKRASRKRKRSEEVEGEEEAGAGPSRAPNKRKKGETGRKGRMEAPKETVQRPKPRPLAATKTVVPARRSQPEASAAGTDDSTPVPPLDVETPRSGTAETGTRMPDSHVEDTPAPPLDVETRASSTDTCMLDACTAPVVPQRPTEPVPPANAELEGRTPSPHIDPQALADSETPAGGAGAQTSAAADQPEKHKRPARRTNSAKSGSMQDEILGVPPARRPLEQLLVEAREEREAKAAEKAAKTLAAKHARGEEEEGADGGRKKCTRSASRSAQYAVLPPCPEDAPEWFHFAHEAISNDSLSAEFNEVLTSLIKLEAAYKYEKSGKSLPRGERPDPLSRWITKGRGWRGGMEADGPTLSAAAIVEFGKTWWLWWESMQPPRRGRPLVRQAGTVLASTRESMGCLWCPGPNSIFLPVLGLYWWGRELLKGTKMDDDSWKEGLLEVNHAITCLLAAEESVQDDMTFAVGQS